MADKILIAQPIYHGLRPDVYANRVEFWQETFSDKDYTVQSLVMGPRRPIRSARHYAIEKAIERKATHLLFLDDDILVPPTILECLLDVDEDIVGGLMHRDDGTPIVFQAFSEVRGMWVKDSGGIGHSVDISDGGEVPWLDHPKTGAFECAAVGAGCMLIRVDVLRKMTSSLAEPGFLFNYDATARSMDVLFCRKARQQGFSVWCWPVVPCIQVKHY